jgi:lysophospholipase L1-like esterase
MTYRFAWPSWKRRRTDSPASTAFALICLFGLSALLPGSANAIVQKPATKKAVKPKTSRSAHLKSVALSVGHRVTHPFSYRKRASARKPYVVAVSPELRLAALNEATANASFLKPQFENSAALVPFFELLSEGQRNSQPVHILQFGDSHTASDDWVNAMRIEFQAKYGAGGPGFTYAGRPYRGYRRFDVPGNNSSGWVTEGTLAQPGDGRDGLGGVSISTRRARETVTLTSSAERLQLLFLTQPGGGSLSLSMDGAVVANISTDGPLGPGFYLYLPPPGEHQYELRTNEAAPVRLLGWAADNNRGVTLETLGINGAQASMILTWDDTIWPAELTARDPALLILAYGTNEANRPIFDPDDYRNSLRAVIAKVRKATPVASILLVGPPDCGARGPLPHLDAVLAIQRAVAAETGVAFWDWRQHMGGPSSTALWVRAGLGQGDHIHLTSDGYRLLGKTLFEELEMEYSTYRAAQPTQSVQTSF